MKINNYILFLDLVSKINELNEKLNKFTEKYMDNALVGAIVVILILVVAFAGVKSLNK